MPDFGSATFSQTDASNNSGTMPSWSGSAAPSTLDDAGRALQGAVTREWNWRNYTLTSTGTGTALVLTYSVAPAAYYNGQRFAFITNTAVTGSCTLAINGLAATTIKKNLGGTLTNLASGDVPAGTYLEVEYNLAGTAFVIVNGILPLITDSSGNVGIGTSTIVGLFQAGNSTDQFGFGISGAVTTARWGSPVTGGQFKVAYDRGAGAVTISTGTIASPVNCLQMNASGDVIVIGPGGLGYGTGSGGSVTQLTSKATGVTLNKTNGVITMNNAALAAGATVSFVVTNSVITFWDTVVVKPSNGNYRAHVTDNANGQFTMIVTNISGVSLSEAVQIAFTILRTVAA